MTTTMQMDQFTNRTDSIVGRRKELESLEEYINDPKLSHFVYIYGQGGIGKTRILEEVLHKIDSAKDKRFPTSRILDLYHTETHDPNDIEHTIITRLENPEQYFKKYLDSWEHFQRLIQRGGSPDQIRVERERLTEYFIEGANLLALEVDKIILLFDTIEQIQLDTSIVEETIGVPKIDPRIRGWILKTLPKISNLLVVFAGRPKIQFDEYSHLQTKDPQERLLEDMQKAFKSQFHPIEISPLSLDEAKELVSLISMGKQILDDEDMPLITQITNGRPILLHLIFDLFNGLSEQPSKEKELLREYSKILNENDPEQIAKARKEFEQRITSRIYENTGMIGEYLCRMALMPKGVDQDILINILGLTEAESKDFLAVARKLSFVKTYMPPNGEHIEQVFLHDEMYRLINTTLKPHYLRSNERAIARNLIDGYFEPRIKEAMQKLEVNHNKLKAMNERAQMITDNSDLNVPNLKTSSNAKPPFDDSLIAMENLPDPELDAEIKKFSAESYDLNNQIHKLQIDKFYYQLAQDPSEGYMLYKRMSYQSAMGRIYGYDIPLLDEFLNFYNSEDHRQWFMKIGILPDQVIRDSALLWIERFHWCADYSLETEFAQTIKKNPQDLFIDPEKHINLLANIDALSHRAVAMLHGYDAALVEEDEALLKRFQATNPNTEEDLIALTRLATTIGYTYRCGGKFDKAIQVNSIGLKAMRELKELLINKARQKPKTEIDPNLYLGEEIILKNNMAFAQAKQGQFMEANVTIQRAQSLSQGRPELRYSMGLTLTIMASIERLQGNHRDALRHGNEAYKLFLEMGDHHGLVRALLNIGSAHRQIAEQELKGGNLEGALQDQLEARDFIQKSLRIAEDGKLVDQAVGMKAELGKIHRGIGKILILQNQRREKYMPFLQKGEDYFRQTISSDRWIESERADIREDLAELLYVMGNHAAALEEVRNVEKDVDYKARFKPGETIPDRINGWIALPLGKAESLRFKIAMENKDYAEAAESFIFAYVYYYRYSENAHQIQHLVETLFDRYLNNMEFDESSKWMKELTNTLSRYGEEIGGVNVKELADRLNQMSV